MDSRKEYEDLVKRAGWDKDSELFLAKTFIARENIIEDYLEFLRNAVTEEESMSLESELKN